MARDVALEALREDALEILDDADHTFTTRSSQQRLREILRDYLTSHFA